VKKVYLLKDYERHSANEIISVSNDVASDLINNEIARYAENRDFLVRPEFGTSKAFKSSPSSIKLRRKTKA